MRSRSRRPARPTPPARSKRTARTVPPGPPTARPRGWPIAAVVAVAGLVRLVLLFQLDDHALLQPRAGLDNAAYLEMARAIAAGDLAGGSDVFFVSPFYLYFAALVLAATGGSVFALQLVQVALGTAAVWCVAATGRLWYGLAGGVVAGALAGLTGVFAFNEVLVLQSSVDVFLAALGLWLVARAWTGGERWAFGATGVVLGLHILNRPNVGLWAAAVVVFTLVWSRRQPAEPPDEGHVRRSAALARAAWLVAGVLVTLAPVAARNLAVSGEFAVVSSHGGLNFYIGNHQGASGTYQEVPGVSANIAGQARDMQQVAGAALGRPVSGVEASRYFYGLAWSWIADRPGAAARLFLRKILYTFNATDVALNDSYAYFARDDRSVLRALFVGPWLLVPFGLAGLVLGRPRADPARLAVWWRWTAFVGVYAVSVAVFFVAGRYRLPLLVALCVTSAGALLALWQAVRAADWRLLAAASIPLGILFWTANLDLGLDDGRAGWRAEAIVQDIQAGRDAEAEAELARLEPGFPNPGLLRYRTARAYLARGDQGKALPHLERAAELSPDRGEVRLEAGQALLSAGRVADAEPHLSAAVAAQPGNSVARSLRGMAYSRMGRREAALADFEAAVALDPADPAAQLNLAVAYAEAGRLADARAAVDAALRLQPDYPRARAFLRALGGRN